MLSRAKTPRKWADERRDVQIIRYMSTVLLARTEALYVLVIRSLVKNHLNK